MTQSGQLGVYCGVILVCRIRPSEKKERKEIKIKHACGIVPVRIFKELYIVCASVTMASLIITVHILVIHIIHIIVIIAYYAGVV